VRLFLSPTESDDVSCGSKAVLTAPKSDFCSTPMNGHRQTAPACPKSATNGLMHCSKRRCYSIISAARIAARRRVGVIRGDPQGADLPRTSRCQHRNSLPLGFQCSTCQQSISRPSQDGRLNEPAVCAVRFGAEAGYVGKQRRCVNRSSSG
jgi:hypothetical protein